MILLTDGGSTKCDWILIGTEGKVISKTTTLGVNPAVLPKNELRKRILQNGVLTSLAASVNKLDFYGAGCSTKTPVSNLERVLKEIFENAVISVNEDTVAAVYATTSQPGIVCILGTGSNSCYFDGTLIHSPMASLGYSLMDEASGNYFGKRLLRDYFYNKMPAKLATAFENKFNLDPDEIKLNLYQRPNPNMYLASFASFIFDANDNKDSSELEVNGYFYKLISEGIHKFIACRVLCFDEAQELPIHFVGSIAHFSSAIIGDCLKEHELELGNIVQRPIEGLISYYQQKLYQS